MANNAQIMQNIAGLNISTDMGGIMIVGIINKRFSNSKMIGSVINYSLLKGTIRIRVLLDANKKRLIVFTPTNP